MVPPGARLALALPPGSSTEDDFSRSGTPGRGATAGAQRISVPSAFSNDANGCGGSMADLDAVV